MNALIPAGERFLTPSGQPRRLGDGFYKQKLVADEILATTGQRFQEDCSNNDSQYKQHLANGAEFAKDNGIKLGAALTEEYQRDPQGMQYSSPVATFQKYFTGEAVTPRSAFE